MTARLTSAMLVSALVRRADGAGGSAMVLARGDATSGAILLLLLERGADPRFVERGVGPDGVAALLPSGPRVLADEAEASAYWRRRRERDSDLWVVELDIAGAERFAAETMNLC
ncbi:hypothetical protein S2M10_18710 [Sphingomonas sp. S2M10]|jgi:hypothetical protein|uniref:DUF1491 family protein n=1 Tax=Sphingomonas sp. S2M10 TaxID=2705010 RepID=UPI001456DF19|nr:DUF1491 family protein [Sphingomonas sp. S2M10]NLS26883.1 hypothetical protein [Sphingomonas sp. S2M10]